MKDSPCRLCGATAELDEADPCWGWLPGVKWACCGHGDLINHRYITTENGRHFHGPAAMADYDDWRHTVEGRHVIVLMGHGWWEAHGWDFNRNIHAHCGLPYVEHACPARPRKPRAISEVRAT